MNTKDERIITKIMELVYGENACNVSFPENISKAQVQLYREILSLFARLKQVHSEIENLQKSLRVLAQEIDEYEKRHTPTPYWQYKLCG